LTGSEIKFLADKVHVHKWPQDTPIWNESIQKQIDDSVNKKTIQKHIVITGKIISIEDIQFTSLKKIGVSVPFFKDECTLIFEAQFKNLFAHVHITKKLGNYLELFNQLMTWKNSLLSE
jgi:hypothetical protein